MVELKEAVQAAMKFAREYLVGELKDLALEEVEKADASSDWLITLGYTLPRSRYAERSEIGALLHNTGPKILEYPREYKRFVVDGESGQVKAMSLVEI